MTFLLDRVGADCFFFSDLDPFFKAFIDSQNVVRSDKILLKTNFLEESPGGRSLQSSGQGRITLPSPRRR